MSIVNLEEAYARIIDSDSDVLVYKHGESFNVVFADTINSQMRIKHKDPVIIGVFNKKSNLLTVRKALEEHIRG